MKILQINSVYGLGSTGIICKSIAESLAEQGERCLTLYGRNHPVKPLPNALYLGNRLDLLTHVAMTRLFDRCGLHSKHQTREFIKAAEEFNPDIIHLHNIHGYFLNHVDLFQFLSEWNKPIVWTLHDCWSFTGHCPHFTKAGCERWKTGCYACPERLTYPRSWLVDRSSKNYVEKKKYFNLPKNITLVTPSTWLADLTRQSFLADYPVRVIPNGISIPEPNSSRDREVEDLIRTFPKSKDNLFLAVAAQWDERKNLSDVLTVAEAFKDRANTLVVGELKGEFKKQTFPDHIRHISRTGDRDYLFSLYRRASLFINSTLEDNYPTVNLEAVASHLPVFTYPTGGSAETIHGYGVVTKRKSSTEMIDSIASYLDGRIHFDAENLSLDYLSQATMTDRYLELYRSLKQDC